ncbi:MAG: NUDIX hydrolase [Nitratireductor sp.]|nr:NUDIX hydrolase [Nitratireductor sp.]
MEFTIESNEVLSQEHHVLRKIRYRAKGSDGKEQEASREVFERGEASSVLLHHKERDSLIFVRQFRLPVALWGEDPMVLEAAAGGLDEGESPLDAALRECQEETGYEPVSASLVCVMHPSPAAVQERLHLFIAEVDDTMRKGEGGGLQDEHEDVETVEIPVAEARRMLQTGAIRDAKTIILLQWFFVNRA